MIADVLDQSADNLIDGVTSAQENKYTFSHYYGNRREDGNHLHRDFAQEGGFLCPSGTALREREIMSGQCQAVGQPATDNL